MKSQFDRCIAILAVRKMLLSGELWFIILRKHCCRERLSFCCHPCSTDMGKPKNKRGCTNDNSKRIQRTYSELGSSL